MNVRGLSTVASCPWLSKREPSKPKAEKTVNKKKAVVENICYPIFIKYSEAVEDPFWRNVLRQAALGKLPNHFSYNSGFLTHRMRNKTQTLSIPASIHEATSHLIAFFREYGGLSSEIDQANIRKAEMEEHRLEMEKDIKWATLRKKMRNVYIAHYVLDLKDKYDLTPKEEEELRRLLNKSLTLKLITADHITIDSRRITDITCLLFDEKMRTFSLDETQISYPDICPYIPRQIVDEGKGEKSKVQFLSNWTKTVREMQNKRERGQRSETQIRFPQKGISHERAEESLTSEASSVDTEDGALD